MRRSSSSSQAENSYYWPPGSVIPSFFPGSGPVSGTEVVTQPTPLRTLPNALTSRRQYQPPPVQRMPPTENDENFSLEDIKITK